MGAGKNPYLRYRIIHTCLSNKRKRYWSLRDFIEQMTHQDLNVNKRSIERDIECMRYDVQLGYFAPILYDRKAHGYYYSNPDFRLDGLQFTIEDCQAINSAVQILQQQKFVEVVDKLETVFQKLITVIDRL